MKEEVPNDEKGIPGLPPWVNTLVFFLVAALCIYRSPAFSASIICLGILIFVHELGHFTVAKWQGMRVEVFSIGFGPALLKWEQGGTVYQLAAFPLGGFVRPAGEEPKSDEDIANAKPDEFMGKPWWSRGLVIAAGPLTNLVFPVLLLFVVYASLGRPYPYGPPQITEISVGSGAQEAGIQLGDLVMKVDGVPVSSTVALAGMVDKASRQHPETPIQVELQRKGKALELKVRTKLNGEAGRYLMGVHVERSNLAFSAKVLTALVSTPAEKAGLKKGDLILEVGGQPLKDGGAFPSQFAKAPSDPVKIKVQRDGAVVELDAPKKQPIPASWAEPEQVGLLGVEFEPLEGAAALHRRDKLGIKQAFLAAAGDTEVGILVIVFGVKETILGRVKARDVLGGPVAILRMAKQQADKGWEDLMNLMVNISLTLGLMNLLPVPVLDGGTLMLCFIEGIRRKPLKLRTQTVLQNVGLTLLISLLAFTLFNDLSRLFGR